MKSAVPGTHEHDHTQSVGISSDQIEEMKTKGLHFHLRVPIEGEQNLKANFDGQKSGDQSQLEQLSRVYNAQGLKRAAIDAVRSTDGRGAVRPFRAPWRCTCNSRTKWRNSKHGSCVVFQSASPQTRAPSPPSSVKRPHHFRRTEPCFDY